MAYEYDPSFLPSRLRHVRALAAFIAKEGATDAYIYFDRNKGETSPETKKPVGRWILEVGTPGPLDRQLPGFEVFPEGIPSPIIEMLPKEKVLKLPPLPLGLEFEAAYPADVHEDAKGAVCTLVEEAEEALRLAERLFHHTRPWPKYVWDIARTESGLVEGRGTSDPQKQKEFEAFFAVWDDVAKEIDGALRSVPKLKAAIKCPSRY